MKIKPHYISIAYWKTIINWHNLGLKYTGFSKEVAEANVKFLKELKIDKTKIQCIQITSKGYLKAHLNDKNELVPFNIIK